MNYRTVFLWCSAVLGFAAAGKAGTHDDPLLRRIGLLPKARREQGGRFRRYDGNDVARLRVIRRPAAWLHPRRNSQTAPVSRSERRTDPLGSPEPYCRAYCRHSHENCCLQAMERVLTEAMCECEAGQNTRCPLIEVISGSAD